MDEIKVAFIDDGINREMLPELEKVELYTVERKKVIPCSNSEKNKKLTHGTICVKIFSQYVKKKVSIISIEILDSKKRCSADKLIVALNWIKSMKIKIVNISLGTSFFQDEICLRKCVNELAENGHIIIAAQNNNFFVTYPASFTNVIGVSASPKNQNVLQNPQYILSGIDFCAKSEHDIEMKGNRMVTQHANSFATPYITSMVTNLYNDKVDVLDMKKKLCSLLNNKIYEIKNCDWFNSAVIVHSQYCNFDYNNFCFKIVGKYYFDEIERKIDEIENIFRQGTSNTLIILTDDNNILESIRLRVKVTYYLMVINTGSKNSLQEVPHLDRTFIVKEQKLKIIFSDEIIKKIDIPIIVIYYNGKELLEALYRIKKVKETFLNNGYNCKIFIDNNLGILYGFEYMSENISVEEYIKFYMIDLMLILIDMKKQSGYIDGDLQLKFNIIKDIKYENIYEYLIEQF